MLKPASLGEFPSTNGYGACCGFKILYFKMLQTHGMRQSWHALVTPSNISFKADGYAAA